MSCPRAGALALIYGGAPLLIDQGTLLRDAVGPLLARAEAADFAVARLRLGAVDLSARELGGLKRCRVLVEHADAVTSGEPLGASRQTVRARLELLLAFLESGRVEVRVGAGRCWAPDFSVLHGLRGQGSAVDSGILVLGAHFFSRPYPVSGPALTYIAGDARAVVLADRAFEELWSGGYDVAFVIAGRLRRLLATWSAGRDAGSASRLVPSCDGTAPAPTPLVRETGPFRSHPGFSLPVLPAAASPADAARAALALRFGTAIEGAATGNSRVFDLADFQRDAVARAEEALARHRGVLLADGVGLGKTFLGLALAEMELTRGGSVVVLSPAALRREWLTPLRRLARKQGSGLFVPGPDRREHGSARLTWLSHTRLSRGGAAGLPSPTLVVVDEAHAFRHPHTRRYRALAAFCQHSRVALLSATPINNSLWDLYFQLRLFAPDGGFAGVGIPSLEEAFRSAAESGDPAAILPVLREVVIRRTRPFLRDNYGAVALPGVSAPLRFPRRASPQPVHYELARAFPGGLSRIAKILGDLTFSPYRPAAYGSGKRCDSTAAELLRFSLLKRLESGSAAFSASVRTLIGLYEAFLRALSEERLLRPRERSLVACDQLLLAAVALDPLPARADAARMAADAGCDLDALRSLLTGMSAARDAKVERLRALLGSLTGKVVVFTEFRETAKQLAGALTGHRVGLVHGGGAWLGGSPIGRRELITRFAPRANAAPTPAPAEQVDVLIATDVLAEGLNLQDASCVISYDLPWNPVRLMQRIGRIDRLGSPHEEVRPYHFVPENGLEELLGLLRRIRRRLGIIRRTVPGDVDILDRPGDVGALDPSGDDHLLGRRHDETANARILAGEEAALDRAERRDGAPFEAVERLRRLAAGTAGRRMPADDATLTAAFDHDGASGDRVLLCYDGPAVVWLLWREEDGLAGDNDLAAAEVIAAALDRQGAAPMDAESLARVDAAGRSALARRARSPACPARGVVARASRRLLGALASSRHSPDPGTCARADLLLERLGGGLNAGDELELKAALARAGSGAEDLVEQLERALPLTPHGSHAAREQGEHPGIEPRAGEGDPWAVSWRLRVAIHARAGGCRPHSCNDLGSVVSSGDASMNRSEEPRE